LNADTIYICSEVCDYFYSVAMAICHKYATAEIQKSEESEQDE